MSFEHLGGLLLWFAAAAPLADAKVSKGLTVHEWGTFTSVAGEDGVAVDWDVRKGPSDLPSFVYTAEQLAVGKGDRAYWQYGKGDKHLVRMETPVLYFYSDREREVSVRVNFPKGRITEWYPHAATPRPGDGGFIDWGRFKIIPTLQVALPDEHAPSHYYAAREVDASELQVCGGAKPEVEKFLFYRGVGDFKLPFSARLEGNHVALSSGSASPVRAMLFERKGDRVGFRWVDATGRETVVDRPLLEGSVDAALSALTEHLRSTGLFPKEAAAMVKTWRDQWFEDGLRVFYVLPRSETDAVLPLRVEPSPDALVRVLVARVEILTPERVRDAHTEWERLKVLPRAEAEESLTARFGRFAAPLLARAAAL